jgi:hypothetical protein
MIITQFYVPIYSSLVTTDLMPHADDRVRHVTVRCVFDGFMNERPCVRYLGPYQDAEVSFVRCFTTLQPPQCSAGLHVIDGWWIWKNLQGSGRDLSQHFPKGRERNSLESWCTVENRIEHYRNVVDSNNSARSSAVILSLTDIGDRNTRNQDTIHETDIAAVNTCREQHVTGVPRHTCREIVFVSVGGVVTRNNNKPQYIPHDCPVCMKHVA